jgi:hypothetical protein
MIVVRGFDSQRRMGIFLFTTVSRTALGPTKPPMQWVPGIFSLGVKRPGRESDHSTPSSAEVKNAWSCTSTPQYVFTAWCLVKHRDNFTFYIYLLSIIKFLKNFSTFVYNQLYPARVLKILRIISAVYTFLCLLPHVLSPLPKFSAGLTNVLCNFKHVTVDIV